MILLLGLLIASLGVAFIVYSGSRDTTELVLLVSSGDSPSAGGAERPVDRPVSLGPGAIRGVSRLPSSPVIRPGDEGVRPAVSRDGAAVGRASQRPLQGTSRADSPLPARLL